MTQIQRSIRSFVAALLVLSLTVQSAFAQGLPATPPMQPPALQKTSPKVDTGVRRSSAPVERNEEEEERVPEAAEEQRLKPFGSNLFLGNFAKVREDGLNPDYVVMPGDHVAMKIWGAIEVNQVFVVDGQGNIFVPQVGPIRIAGVENSRLTEVVRAGLSRVYTRYFDVYTNLMTATPVGVFVTGGVERPGRYAGTPSDSTLFFLDQAGGISAELGSYRNIEIIREGKAIAQIDLYDFILGGKMSDPQFKDGDTILVKQRGPVVELRGKVAQPSMLEFKKNSQGPAPDQLLGSAALAMIPEAARATEVTVVGLRSGVPVSRTLTIAQFRSFRLQNGDHIELRDDGHPDAILVQLEGEFDGPTMLAVNRSARLVDVLHRVPVDLELSNIDAIHIRRASVAKAQKDAIDDALFRLERSALLALSGSDAETNIRVKEADLVQRFVERARNIQPLGRVVTSRNDHQLNIRLEEGDIIVIPPKTNIVRVSGEVFMAQALMYTPGTTASDYVKQAGGFSERAETSRLVIHHQNAQVEIAGPDTLILPGDEILVPPKVDTKVIQGVIDITQIIYQVAVSAALIVLLAK